MIKRIIPVALLGLVIIANSSCTNKDSGFQTKDGLEYKIVKDVPGKTAQIGDMLELNIRFKIVGPKKDTVIFDSRKADGRPDAGKPIQMPLQMSSYRGDLSSGLTLMSAGDSAIFRISVDSIQKAMKGQPLPPFMKSGDKLVYEVTMVSVKSKADYAKELDAKNAQQLSTDDKILQDYFAKNNIKATKTASGLYYTVSKEGTGDVAKPGQTVTMNYTGKTLEGKKFDSNVDTAFHHTEPFKFTLGQGAVIKGWDEGVALMKKGEKATLYVPSPLAYGAQSPSPLIPANSILIFDVEMVDAVNGK